MSPRPADASAPRARRQQNETSEGEDAEFSLAWMLAALQSRVAYARQHTTRSRVLFFLKQHVPILEWLPTYDVHEDLSYDLVAGITVGLMIVPQEISLSTMMGVPPIYGLYTAALVPMIYPLFGTSRVLSVANGSEVSLLVGSAIKKIESEDERVATGILLSFLGGSILFLMGIFRLGIIADFFSRPVMGGFISAGGVLIMLSQCANWFGVKVPNHDLPFLTVLDLFEKLGHWNTASLAVGALSIAILVGMRTLKRSVVAEMRRLEEELDEEMAVATSRALSRLQSLNDNDENDKSDAMDTYDDIELGAIGKEEKKVKKTKKKANDDELEQDDGVAPSPVAADSRPSSVRISSTPNFLPSVFSSRSTRRTDLLSSPWSSSTRSGGGSMRGGSGELLGDAEARSTRQSDIALIRSTSRSRVIKDDGVGFSLSDEDFLHLEQPLEYSFLRKGGPPTLKRNTSTSSHVGSSTPRRLEQLRVTTPMRATDSLGTDEEEDSSTTKPPAPLEPVDAATAASHTKSSDETKMPAAEPQPYARVKNMASPAKSVVSDTASITDSTCSTTALNGRTLNAMVSSSKSVRLLRSKIAVLIALRLVCELGAFMVCLIGGIIGYLVGKDTLKLTGEVPGGFPAPILPWYGFLKKIIETDRLYHIVIDTLSIAIISYMSSIAMAKRLAIKEGYRIRPNQELIALGISNLVGSFFGSMPATGGLSRTAVNMQNARTQLASLITVGVVIIVLYTATSVLAYLPKASLSAIIIVAGHSLIEIKEAQWLYRVKRDEFYVWLASFVLTVLLGVLPGLLSSIFCSLIAVIYKTRRPTLTMLGEICDEATGEKRLVDLELYPETAHPLSDIVVIRVEGALYFANCEYVERVVEREISKREQTEGVYVAGVIIDACSIMDWDSTTIQMMKHLKEDLHVRNIQLAIVNARDRLQHLLESTEFLYGIVREDAQISFDDAISAIRECAVVPLDLRTEDEATTD
jgi:MFS superfamily sulfate permease-like transporter